MKRDQDTPYICELIDRRINELGVKAMDVAQAVGVANATVSQWRKFKVPAGKRWAAICEILQIEPTELLGMKGDYHGEDIGPCEGNHADPGEETEDLRSKYIKALELNLKLKADLHTERRKIEKIKSLLSQA